MFKNSAQHREKLTHFLNKSISPLLSLASNKVSSGCPLLLDHILEGDQPPKVLWVDVGEWTGGYLGRDGVENLFCDATLFRSCAHRASEDICSGGPPGPLACQVCPLAPPYPENLTLDCSPISALHSTEVASPHPASLLHGAPSPKQPLAGGRRSEHHQVTA